MVYKVSGYTVDTFQLYMLATMSASELNVHKIYHEYNVSKDNSRYIKHIEYYE